jgi:hypothetical protein
MEKKVILESYGYGRKTIKQIFVGKHFACITMRIIALGNAIYWLLRSSDFSKPSMESPRRVQQRREPFYLAVTVSNELSSLVSLSVESFRENPCPSTFSKLICLPSIPSGIWNPDGRHLLLLDFRALLVT